MLVVPPELAKLTNVCSFATRNGLRGILFKLEDAMGSVQLNMYLKL